jgi:hypothetical protein
MIAADNLASNWRAGREAAGQWIGRMQPENPMQYMWGTRIAPEPTVIGFTQVSEASTGWRKTKSVKGRSDAALQLIARQSTSLSAARA